MSPRSSHEEVGVMVCGELDRVEMERLDRVWVVRPLSGSCDNPMLCLAIKILSLMIVWISFRSRAEMQSLVTLSKCGTLIEPTMLLMMDLRVSSSNPESDRRLFGSFPLKTSLNAYVTSSACSKALDKAVKTSESSNLFMAP